VLRRGGETDVVGGIDAFPILLADVGAVELISRSLDHLRLKRGRSIVDHEDHRVGRGGGE